ncbi:MAG: endonuclease MutS2 [Spirochaetales bacterium]|nr:endonuclease MutS2 [Spirochaetales bacterium]
MDSQTTTLLEFYKIKKEISSLAKSPGGSRLILEQTFDTDEDVLDYKKNIVSDFKSLHLSDIKLQNAFFADINFLLKCRKEGMSLEGIELADLASFINAAATLKRYCLSGEEKLNLTGSLLKEAEKIQDLSNISQFILKEINIDGSVKDDHPLLKNARSNIASLNGKISKVTSKYMSANKDIWQSTVASQRDGRIVLPLKANFKGRVNGLVHEVSSSGATIFVEPFELVELNNDMTFEQNQLRQIEYKIFANLSNKVRESLDEIIQLVEQVSFLDSWYARAIYSIKNKCVRPLNVKDSIILKNARHPLLGKNAVPISLSFTNDVLSLIITGPNAGGKTVTLKTCGLFVLLNQFSVELPADEGTAISIYNNVFADIGDDQSIEESLSTFSGHMKRISEIINQADQKSLILLDELGSGTDPVQGSAIATSILEYLGKNKVQAIVTSHHSSVKNFGYTYKGARNASVAFDTETMKPTYEIIEGIPGESHAVDIAVQMGLPKGVIEKTEKLLENGNTDISRMIKELESRQFEVLENEKRLKEENHRLIEERRRLDLTKLKIKQNQYELNLKDYSRLKGFVRESRKELENLVRELREGEITKEKTRKVKEHIENIENKMEEEKERLENEEKEIVDLEKDKLERPADMKQLCSGITVKYSKNGKKGVLLEERKKNNWLVAFGNIKLEISSENLIPVKELEKNKVISNFSRIKNDAVFELDLRGMRVYEAETAVQKQIDSAILGGIHEFSIIHGLGEGILQRSVRDFLAQCSAVKDFHYSDPELGGFGKTVVRL